MSWPTRYIQIQPLHVTLVLSLVVHHGFISINPRLEFNKFCFCFLNSQNLFELSLPYFILLSFCQLLIQLLRFNQLPTNIIIMFNIHMLLKCPTEEIKSRHQRPLKHPSFCKKINICPLYEAFHHWSFCTHSRLTLSQLSAANPLLVLKPFRDWFISVCPGVISVDSVLPEQILKPVPWLMQLYTFWWIFIWWCLDMICILECLLLVQRPWQSA